jgi:hypothetical protein
VHMMFLNDVCSGMGMFSFYIKCLEYFQLSHWISVQKLSIPGDGECDHIFQVRVKRDL